MMSKGNKVDKLFNNNEYVGVGVDPKTGAWLYVDSFYDDDDISRTKGGAEYSIFEDDELSDHFHIEIQPDSVWSKEDIWELIDDLLYRAGEIDENGNLIGEYAEKPLFLIHHPMEISVESAKKLTEVAKEALKEAKIDAVPLVLSNGVTVRFDHP